MPGTPIRTLTKAERRQQRAFEVVCLGLAGIVFGTFAVFLVFYTVLDLIVIFNTDLCFTAARDCEVVSITHEYNASDLTCSDSFAYVWKFFESPVLFEQVERRERARDECFLDLDISEKNATFRNGTNTCFRVNELFSLYTTNFNCAPLKEKNATEVGRCQTLLPPETNFTGVLSWVLLGICLCGCLVPILSYFDNDDDFPLTPEQIELMLLGLGAEGLAQGHQEEDGENEQQANDNDEQLGEEVGDNEEQIG